MRIPVTLTALILVASNAFAWDVTRVQGDVTVKGKDGTLTGRNAMHPLKAGDVVITGADGKALIQDGESEVWLAPKTEFKIHQLADSAKDVQGRLDVLKGAIRCKFKRPSGPEAFPYDVKARSVIAGVRGTEFYVEVEKSDEKVCTLEGLVRVTSLKSSAESWDVAAGHGLVILPREMPKIRESSGDQSKKWIAATTF